MTNTVTLVADHKGSTRPQVLGDEYEVTGTVAISSYATGATGTAASQTITAASSGKTYTRDAGSYLTDGFEVGDMFSIAGSHADNNDNLDVITAVTDTIITCAGAWNGPTQNDTGGGNEALTGLTEKLLATSFGLSKFNTIEVVGQNNTTVTYTVTRISNDKSYACLLALTTGAAGGVIASMPSGDIGTVTIKAKGLI